MRRFLALGTPVKREQRHYSLKDSIQNLQNDLMVFAIKFFGTRLNYIFLIILYLFFDEADL